MKKITIIIPCFNEGEAVLNAYQNIYRTFLKQMPINWDLLFIDDGSTDKTASLLMQLNKRDKKVKGLSFSRNFGHQAAIQAGIDYCSSDYIGIIDCDLQDPIETLIKLFENVYKKKYDVAYGIRTKRKESILLRIGYSLFYKAINLISDSNWPENVGDFCVVNRKAANLIKGFPEKTKILRGLRAYIGLNQVGIPYERPKRIYGTSKYNLIKLSQLAISSFVSFSSLPLRLSSLVGFLLGFVGVLLCFVLILNRIKPELFPFGYFIGSNPGITTLALLYLFFTSMILFTLGIIGEYMNYILTELKARPTYIVKSKIGKIQK